MIIEKKLTARMMMTIIVMDWDNVEADQAENEDNNLMMKK
jgi:hypothetical protein